MGRDIEREVTEMVEEYPRVEKVKRYLSRTAGGRFIVDLDVIMQTQSRKTADTIADQLEKNSEIFFQAW